MNFDKEFKSDFFYWGGGGGGGGGGEGGEGGFQRKNRKHKQEAHGPHRSPELTAVNMYM